MNSSYSYVTEVTLNRRINTFWNILLKEIHNSIFYDNYLKPSNIMFPIGKFFNKLGILYFMNKDTIFTENGKEIFKEIFSTNKYYLNIGKEISGRHTIASGSFCFGFYHNGWNITLLLDGYYPSNFVIFVDDVKVLISELNKNVFEILYFNEDELFKTLMSKYLHTSSLISELKNNNERKRNIDNISSSNDESLPIFLSKKQKINEVKPIVDSDSTKNTSKIQDIQNEFSPPSSPEITEDEQIIVVDNKVKDDYMERLNLIDKLLVNPILKMKLMKSNIDNDTFRFSLFFFKGDDISKMEEYFKGLLSENN
jgi:hypothetical protein